jgi:hypothetical protein
MHKVLKLGFFYYRVMVYFFIFLGLGLELEINQTYLPPTLPYPPNMA